MITIEWVKMAQNWRYLGWITFGSLTVEMSYTKLDIEVKFSSWRENKISKPVLEIDKSDECQL